MTSTADELAEYIPGADNDDSEDGSFEELEDEEEENERPNRWHGPKSTWQHFNAEEIDTLAALREIRDRDLAVHLYDASALKRRALSGGGENEEPVIGKDIDATTGLPVQQDNWRPPRSWTAWPMRVDRVPPPRESVRSMMHDPDERFTFKKAVLEMPSSALEEIIGAQILKTAKDKFNVRPWAAPSESDGDAEEYDDNDEERGSDEDWEEEADASVSTGRSKSKGSRSRSRTKSVNRENMSGDEKMDGVDESQLEDEPPKKPYLKPAVSTDDDLSYNLLRPSVRHILAKLDTTLTILHNVQESMLNYQSDSADSEASDSSHRSGRSNRSSSQPGSKTPTAKSKRRGRPPGPTSQARPRGQPRTRELSMTLEDPLSTEGEGQATRKRRLGRPPKAWPRLDGESDKDFAMRIARLRKRPLPIFSADEDSNSPASLDPDSEALGRDSGNSGDGEETVGPRRGRPIRRKRKLGADDRSISRTSSISNASKQRHQKRGRSTPRHGLRDWRDVLGAAALAGFPAAALDRAARRCADLFGQSMVLHTLVESPVASSRKVPPGRTTTYVPGMPYPPLLEVEEAGEGDEGQRRSMVLPMRAANIVVGATTSEDEAGPSRRTARERSVSRPRGRSRSASAAPGSYVCSFRDCPRAAEGEGFSRRQNLLRHMKLVHGRTVSDGVSGGEETMLLTDEVDSEDEMHGAVHVDGFLRPIRMRPGWRGADVSDEPRKRRSGYGKGRARGRGRFTGGESVGTEENGGDEDIEGDTRMGDGSGYDQ